MGTKKLPPNPLELQVSGEIGRNGWVVLLTPQQLGTNVRSTLHSTACNIIVPKHRCRVNNTNLQRRQRIVTR